jgi:RHS repeat-associated protein
VLFKVDAESYLDNPPTQRACDQFQVNSGLDLCTGVLALNGADGSVRQRYIAPNDNLGRENNAGGHLIVADLTGSGTPNLVANGAVWDVAGNLVSNRLGTLHRSIALAKLDDSGQVSIVSYEVGGNSFIVARHADGTVQWRTPIDNSTVTGLLSVADLDGDGSPEIMATSEGNLYVYDATGQIKWTHRYADASNLRTIDLGKRPVAFDLDGDGIAEVIVATSQGLEFNDGKTGKTKFVAPWPDLGLTNVQAGYPNALSMNAVVADIDGSGHASIVFEYSSTFFGATQYIVAVGATNHDWRAAPTVYNEFSYHASNVDNVGHIPTAEANAFATPRTNIFGTQAQAQAPVDPRVHSSTRFTYAASNGTQTSNAATVTIDLRPQNSPPVFTSVAPTVYVPFAFTYAAHAADPDPGDSVTYSLLLVFGNGANSCSIGATSGLVTCVNLFFGDQFFTVVATDTQGASAFQTVHLVQSAGPATVPNVVGQSRTTADATLTAAGFVTGNVSSIYFAAPAGQVLTQFPAAGATALTGSAIALQVSLGAPPQAVPDLIGLQLSVARNRLTGFGFGIIVIPVASPTAPAGEVVAQDPAFGTLLAPPSPVTVSVSIGPPITGTVAKVIVQPGPNPLRVAGESLNFTATAVFTDGTSADVTLASLWDTSAPAVASVDNTGSARALTAGPSTISAKVNGVTGQSILTVVARNTGDNVNPVAAITAPADGATVNGITQVVGTATDANFVRYELAFAPGGTTDWTVFASGTTPVAASALGQFDPTTLINGAYTLRLTVYDSGGNASVASVGIVVSGQQKPGLFKLSYVDLNVAAAGIALTVTRAYDSRDKTQGDFGFGWQLGLNTMRVAPSTTLGSSWHVAGGGTSYALVPDKAHSVAVTLADGRVQTFDLVITPSSSFLEPFSTVQASFVPRPGATGTIDCLDNPNLLIIDSQPGVVSLLDDTTLNTFDPHRFRYTTIDGTAIDFDANGVTKVTDARGNSTTFGPAGIVSSSGQSVAFTRDAQKRITSITDPTGNVQTYHYDANGNLASHTNAVGATSTYTYDYLHNLLVATDPKGSEGVRNTYDDAGHLIASTDAAGHTVSFAYNPGAQTSTVTDRLGHVTVLAYDADGNVTSTQSSVTIAGSAVLASTTSTYDSLGNPLTNIDADGIRSAGTWSGNQPLTQVTDPGGLALTTSYVYNGVSDPTLVTDPAGHAYAFTYGANRTATQTTLPGRGTINGTFDSAGKLLTSADALGTTTTYTYDAAGRETRAEVRDASSTLLRRVDHAYDANGNRISESIWRTVSGTLTPFTTQFSYDGASRPVATTDPLGNVSRIEYDANGSVTATVDALGRRTTMTYDSLGRLVATTFANGSTIATSYDANGNTSTETDPAGRVTSHVYDELNREVATTFPDGSTAQTIYSPGGRVDATIDANGNRTDYDYDSADRQVSVRYAAVASGPGGPLTRPQASTARNAVGQPTSTTDPNGHTVQFAYDANGHLVQTTFADGSKSQQTWDALGRRTSVTDEDGNTTTFQYDGLGRMVAASGLAGNAQYTYDEAGNVVTRTDALGRVTRLDYDARAQVVRRTYPSGATEQYTYDAVGNVVAYTDGLGRVATYAYDVMDRLVKKVLPDGATVTYVYAADGQRVSVSDARGTTSYAYDSAGRLAAVTNPGATSLHYAYDGNGNVTSLATPATTVGYQYDAADRLTRVTAPAGSAAAAYDLGGNRLRLTSFDGIVSDAAYDVRNRLSNLSHKTPASTLLRSYAHTYSAAGRLVQTAENDASVDAYGYDAKGRLVTQTRTGANAFTATHTYDAVGNRTQTTMNSTTTNFTYDNDDRLLSDGVGAYAWDANGNLVSRGTPGGTVTYGYDAENRLVSINGGGFAEQYAYDADGNRVQAITAAGTANYLVDELNPTGYSQVLEERNAGGTLQSSYVFGNELVGLTAGANTRVPLGDGKGSVLALADGGASITDTYQYDAFGKPIHATGSTANPHRYRGERLDANTGLYQLRARSYDPAQGRFFGRDPLGGSIDNPSSQHRYQYAYDDPVNFIDPTGEEGTVIEELGAWSADAPVEVANATSAFGKYCTASAMVNTVAKVVGFGALAYAGYQLSNKLGNGAATGFAFGYVDLQGFDIDPLTGVGYRLKRTNHHGAHYSGSLDFYFGGGHHGPHGATLLSFQLSEKGIDIQGGGKVQLFAVEGCVHGVPVAALELEAVGGKTVIAAGMPKPGDPAFVPAKTGWSAEAALALEVPLLSLKVLEYPFMEADKKGFVFFGKKIPPGGDEHGHEPHPNPHHGPHKH